MMINWPGTRRVLKRYARDLPAAIRAERPSPLGAAMYAALVAALIGMSVLAAAFDRFPGDVRVTREIQSLGVPGLTSAMRLATDFTSPVSSLLTLAVVVMFLLLLRQPRLAIFSVASLSAHALGAFLKVFVDRERPDPSLVDVVRIEERFSYPSGHVEWVVSFEGFLVFAVWRLVPSSLIRGVAVGVWMVHLILTSMGRIDQGLHWPSDVVASYFVGGVALAAVVWAYRVSLQLVPPPTRDKVSETSLRQDLLEADHRRGEPHSPGEGRIG
jgi:undecaprenyl-diphosphatase